MRTYVVSGAASGIGAATAALLREQGGRVITVDLRDADVVADLSTAEGRAVAVAGVQQLTDVVHGVVPCAGIAGSTGVDAALVVSVNFFGAVELVRGLQPQLAAAGSSAVVLLASNSITGMPGWRASVADLCLTGDEAAARADAAQVESVMVYPATKAALAWWARREGITEQWIGCGIRLNAVAPGMIASPMTDRLLADPEIGPLVEAYPTALGRLGRADEVAQLIAFMLSDANSLMVGSVVYADGGTDAMFHPQSPEGWDV
ncbi:oxidoreductase, short chain dehydrogenase/reductase family protein [Aeromicrobium marinum DSM 15272]|uniref:Oxidoreductase, short chain dehydrogenase/reductase family protein n=1 Tax=Aeromicrobium marinum DSM 15272 TaxID=585531 RepID=E2SEQ2_9ACTN|nr:SDR family oxidoreductase [Aeromicrobium marinum]EFQ82349.1 oxidoreductase, short chain dehydrogenase/reductase family protein [Aeromicrobium marinum DSM 15272]